jgi:hypothetical protein
MKSAVPALLEALRREPTLAEDLAADPLLEPLRRVPRVFEGILAEAERRRAAFEDGE